MKSLWMICATTVVALTSASVGLAAPSFCGAHTHTIELGSGETARKVTVIMDHENPYHWYYFPNELAIGYKNGKPEFSLIRYQFENAQTDDDDDPNYISGGILQFSVTMDLSGIGDELKGKIARILSTQKDPVTKELLKDSTPEAIRVSAMPFDEVEIKGVDAPGEDSSFVTKAHVPDGTGPAYGTQKIPMTFELSRLGSNIFKTLTTDARTGVQVLYEAKYTGMTPDIGFKVHVDWEKTYEHFSHEETHRTSVAANVKGVNVEAAVGITNKDIAQKLIETGAITVDVTEGGELFDNPIEVSEYLEPLLEKIYDKIFEGENEGFEMLSADDSANARETFEEDLSIAELEDRADERAERNASNDAEKSDSKGPDTSGGSPIKDLGDSTNEAISSFVPTIKSETNIALLKISNFASFQADFSFTARSYKQRTAVIGGFIGIGSWREDVQDEAEGGAKLREQMLEKERMLLTVGPGNWESCDFKLPSIKEDFESLGIQYCNVGTTLLDDTGSPVTVGSGVRRRASWTKEDDDKWTGQWVRESTILWSLQEIARRYGDDRFRKFEYLVDVTLKTGDSRQETKFTYRVPVITGESDLASPLSNAGIVTLDMKKLLDIYEAEVNVTVVAGGERTFMRFPPKEKKDRDAVTRRTVILPPGTDQFGLKAELVLDDIYTGTFLYKGASIVKLEPEDFGKAVRINVKKLLDEDDDYVEIVIEGGGETYDLEIDGDDDAKDEKHWVILPRGTTSYTIEIEAEVDDEDYEATFKYADEHRHSFKIEDDEIVD